MTSDKMKARYDLAANSDGFTEGQLVQPYNPQRKKGLTPKLQTHWERSHRVVKRLNDVVYRIQKCSSPRAKMKQKESIQLGTPGDVDLSNENFTIMMNQAVEHASTTYQQSSFNRIYSADIQRLVVVKDDTKPGGDLTKAESYRPMLFFKALREATGSQIVSNTSGT
ncbi:hypothetical protein EVAR_100772_1 [Eumeta japonica]|uniref:Integrase p58-like C-terminal domain-containing protein n=1 Tax=Eumeta variegata TaxID=151549 RepID=A0A4C1TAJ8_EUMVA|nr:hypothetical protein EVAR_100772_1 [Eumeta japonica]